MNKPLWGTVHLPGSKSESNRALMIAAYGGFPIEADHLSEAHDTFLLKTLLERVDHHSGPEMFTVDCEDAGTVARFMMTYLACKPGTWLLTGTERLCQRPMAPLIEALRHLGADIIQPDRDTIPVIIKGKILKGGRVEIDASQSSQFASSLLLAAPTWENGLKLKLKGNLVSMPYLKMTIKIMEHFGVSIALDDDVYTIAYQPYHPCPFQVSSDWSSASYWYEMMALSQEGELLLKGLGANSLQGDIAVMDMFAKMGVNTEFFGNGARISKAKINLKSLSEPLVFDFNNTPDLFPSVFVTCVALGIDAVFKGISILSKKESDRTNSLITELSKIYTFINIVSNDMIIIKKSSLSDKGYNIKNVVFNTYHDHRVAMALAALAPQFERVTVDEPSAVNKSYPDFWDELMKIF